MNYDLLRFTDCSSALPYPLVPMGRWADGGWTCFSWHSCIMKNGIEQNGERNGKKQRACDGTGSVFLGFFVGGGEANKKG